MDCGMYMDMYTMQVNRATCSSLYCLLDPIDFHFMYNVFFFFSIRLLCPLEQSHTVLDSFNMSQ